jgi:hypothetical protein
VVVRYISILPVRSHLDRIRDRTGCRRRAELTRLALRTGDGGCDFERCPHELGNGLAGLRYRSSVLFEPVQGAVRVLADYLPVRVVVDMGIQVDAAQVA